MERLEVDRWWVCICRGDRRVAFDLFWDEEKRRIVAAVIEDDLGYIDDDALSRS